MESASAREDVEEGVDEEPCRDDDTEADDYVKEHLSRLFNLIGLFAGGEILPSAIRKKHRRYHNGKIDAVVEDVLGQLGHVAYGLTSTSAIARVRYDLYEPARRKRERRRDHDKESKQKTRDVPFGYHTDIVAHKRQRKAGLCALQYGPTTLC